MSPPIATWTFWLTLLALTLLGCSGDPPESQDETEPEKQSVAKPAEDPVEAQDRLLAEIAAVTSGDGPGAGEVSAPIFVRQKTLTETDDADNVLVRREVNVLSDDSTQNHGRYTRWYPGGQQKDREGTYANGQKTGEWTYWRKNGEKQAVGSYADNKKEGKWTHWRKDGTLELEEEYRQDKRHGTVVKYDEQGEKISDGSDEDGQRLP